MTVHTLASPQPAASARPLPGTWKLAAGRAVTLRPTQDGILRIAHGQVWATIDGPHGLAPEDSGDHVLGVGRSMFVRAGQRIVIESWCSSGAAYFAWDPVFAAAAVAVPARANLDLLRQPLADLRNAAGLGGLALARLATGLGRLALDLVRPRGLPAGRAAV